MITANIVYFGLGLVLLIKGADYFVEAVTALARKLGVSEFIVGLTIVAIGTSVPELANAVIASVKGEPEIIVGDIVGSNIANIALIIGVSSLFTSLKTDRRMLRRDGVIMLLAMMLFYIIGARAPIGAAEATLFIIAYGLYIVYTVEFNPYQRLIVYLREFARFAGMPHIGWKKDEGYGLGKILEFGFFKKQIHKDAFIMVMGGLAVVLGANLFIDSAVFFAEYLNIGKRIVGISLVAIGTSLPELSVSVAAARKGRGDIVVGNIIGSNIANTLLIVGVASAIAPLNLGELTINYTAPVMMFVSVVFLVFVRRGWEIK
ncbi:MAG: calcium/sodium antiporter, partial [Candidatus Altiarchaeota archaeon]|nr:calcium/sodium antiporter [Candidatus Altiarchaeota archaeon]